MHSETGDVPMYDLTPGPIGEVNGRLMPLTDTQRAQHAHRLGRLCAGGHLVHAENPAPDDGTCCAQLVRVAIVGSDVALGWPPTSAGRTWCSRRLQPPDPSQRCSITSASPQHAERLQHAGNTKRNTERHTQHRVQHRFSIGSASHPPERERTSIPGAALMYDPIPPSFVGTVRRARRRRRCWFDGLHHGAALGASGSARGIRVVSTSGTGRMSASVTTAGHPSRARSHELGRDRRTFPRARARRGHPAAGWLVVIASSRTLQRCCRSPEGRIL